MKWRKITDEQQNGIDFVVWYPAHEGRSGFWEVMSYCKPIGKWVDVECLPMKIEPTHYLEIEPPGPSDD